MLDRVNGRFAAADLTPVVSASQLMGSVKIGAGYPVALLKSEQCRQAHSSAPLLYRQASSELQSDAAFHARKWERLEVTASACALAGWKPGSKLTRCRPPAHLVLAYCPMQSACTHTCQGASHRHPPGDGGSTASRALVLAPSTGCHACSEPRPCSQQHQLLTDMSPVSVRSVLEGLT